MMRNPAATAAIPHSLEAERAVLGALLLDPAARTDLADTDFFLDRHRQIHAAIQALTAQGTGVDLITVTDRLTHQGGLEDVGGRAYLAQLVEEAGTTALLADYVATVRGHAVNRALIAFSAELSARAATGQDLRPILAQLAEVAARRDGTDPAVVFTFEDAGSEFVGTWPAFGIRLTARRLRDHAEGVRGELCVERHGRRLELQIHSLLAATSRATLAKHLAEAEPRLSKDLWAGCLKAFAFKVHDALRTLRAEALTGAAYVGPRFEVYPFVLRDELTLLFAPPGHGKSFLGIAAGVCHVTGRVLPGGLRPREPGQIKRVLFLDSETTRAAFDHRLGALCRGWQISVPPPDSLHYMNIRGKVLADLTDALRAYIVRHGITLVVLDSTLWVAGHDRELSDATIGLYSALARLAVSVLALTHSSRGSTENPYGNILYEAGARLVLRVKRLAADDTALTLQVASHKGNDVQVGPMTFHLAFEDAEPYTWVRLGPLDADTPTPEPAPLTQRDQVLRALHPTIARAPAQLAELTGILRSSVKTVLTRLEADKCAVSTGDGAWIRGPQAPPFNDDDPLF